MKYAMWRLVPCAVGSAACALTLSACQIAPDPDAPAAPAAVAAPAASKGKDNGATERAAAVAEMRARGTASEDLPSASAFAASRNARLAARPEPRAVADTASIKAELATIGERQQRTVSPAEVERLKARAETLRRLLAAQRVPSPPSSSGVVAPPVAE